MEPSVDEYKSGSSITLSKYSTKLAPMLPPRSSELLLLRGPSLPAQSLDLSAELAQENILRRTMHQRILAKDPTAFRKKERAESASSAVHNREKVKDLLGDLHQLKDPKDIDKSKKFTRSLLFEQDLRKSLSLKEYQFNTLKPIEDFVRPDDQFSPRNTGYEHGHIRSMLKLDVFGPASSSQIEKDREAGILPRSPNLDRHTVVSPSHILSLSHRPGTGQSTASSRASTANSTNYNGAFPSLKTLRRERAVVADTRRRDHPERGKSNTSPTFGITTDSLEPSRSSLLRDDVAGSVESTGGPGSDLRHSSLNKGGSWRASLQHAGEGALVEFSGPAIRPTTSSTIGTARRVGSAHSHSTRPSSSAVSSHGGGVGGGVGVGLAASSSSSMVSKGDGSRIKQSMYPDQTFPGVAITEEERLQGGDPFLRRTLWYKQFANNKKARAEDVSMYKEELRHARKQQEIAAEERKRMQDFDEYLVLAKFNP